MVRNFDLEDWYTIDAKIKQCPRSVVEKYNKCQLK